MVRSAMVIGAGPAGSASAVLLARAGWPVTLIEQHRFPRDKVCGECLSATGAAVLQRVGLFDALLRSGAVRLTRTALHAPGGASVVTPLPRPMWGVSRTTLDGLLLDAAREAGATVLQPARVEAIRPGSRPTVRVRDLVTNAVDQLECDVVLVADGKSALLNGGPPPRPTRDLGLKAHFVNVSSDGPRDCIELFGTSDCYGGLAPIEGGRWNAAFSVPAARVRHHGGDLAAVFEELVAENVTLAGRLVLAERVGLFLASPLPRFAVRRDWPPNVIPIGNAAAAIEPIGGEGMGLALRSAELAAGALIRPDDMAPDSLARAYGKLWSARRVACRAAAVAVSSPRCADRFTPLLRAAPASFSPLMTLMGK